MKPIFEKVNKLEDQSFFIEEITKPYFADLWHFHPEIEILYVKEGKGTKYVGDSINIFYPTDIVIIGSNVPHIWSCSPEYLNQENKLISSVICVQFMGDFMEKSSSGIPEMHRIKEFLNRAIRGIQFVGTTRNMLIKHIEELPPRRGMDRLIGLLSILDIMSTSNDIKYLASPEFNPGIINSVDKERMEIIFQYVIKNYPNKIFLEEIASQVSLTPHSFCRYFKSRTTKVFSFFVNEVRIGNACKMLMENKFTLSHICFATGFNCLSNFNRHFKKIKGITPTEFQQKFKYQNFDLMV
jgi:AraC-like DNA-binding protein